MDKKKIFFGAIAIDIVLICLAYLVFYEKPFDEDISILLAWIVIIGMTFMMIITIGLAITIPRKKRIKIRRKSKKNKVPEKIVEFTPIEDKETSEDDSKKVVEKHDLEHITSKSGIVTIRRVTKEDLDEIKEHVHDEKIDIKDEMQKVIDARTKEIEGSVDDLLAGEQTSKIEKSGSQNEVKKETEPPVRQKVRRKTITNEEKIYNYLDEHPDATVSAVRKAAGCKLSSAKKYRSQWLKK